MKKLFIPPVFIFTCLILIVLFYFLIPSYNWIKFPFNLCGIFIALIGLLTMGKSKDLFKKHQTSLAIEKSSFLITEGIFSKTRNPMYLGMFLLLLGIGVCFMNLFSIMTAIGFLVLIHFMVIPKEEKIMYKSFGQDYLEYKKNVNRWI
ncbi:MAG: isoprenylcysteine carboxylmethyltransferase family protein [Bacteroidales bacterium]|nr:isoprenylcysteine carboxylmethyltransferase family protein [Bacteroidales bacterium]